MRNILLLMKYFNQGIALVVKKELFFFFNEAVSALNKVSHLITLKIKKKKKAQRAFSIKPLL